MASKAVLDIKPPQAPQAQYIFTRVEKKDFILCESVIR